MAQKYAFYKMVYSGKLSKLKFKHYGSWFQALPLRNSKIM